MDVLEEELVKFWNTLNANGVRYIMIGGFATRFHGFDRNTDDLDMWLEDTLENRKNLRKSFLISGFGDFALLDTIKFIPGWTGFKISGGIELDILTEMKGLEYLTFNQCLNMASIADLVGTKVPFLHINHLIENKKIVNRPKDQVDVIELEKIRQIRGQEP
jgi:hypothetical protein